MTELEIMQRAEMYINKLANGINPIDDTPVSENDIINNVRISRCLFYVSDILKSVIRNGGAVKQPKVKKEKFNITFDEIQKFPFSDTPITISEIAKRINNIKNSENMTKLTHRHLSDWLVSLEMLEIVEKPDGKTAKRPTSRGNDLGITTEDRVGLSGGYTVVLYNRAAQQFIIDNIDAIIAVL